MAELALTALISPHQHFARSTVIGVEREPFEARYSINPPNQVERNWRFVDHAQLLHHERELIASLCKEFGAGLMNV